MRKIRVNKKKFIALLCIAIPAAAAAVLVPRAVKNAKRGKRACV